jgi:FkbM family methyltransferase
MDNSTSSSFASGRRSVGAQVSLGCKFSSRLRTAIRFSVRNPHVKTLQTRHGPMRALAGDQIITRCLETYGEFSRLEWRLLEQIVRPGMTVVEAGSNIGVHTIPLARACAPGTLYAFEPQAPVFALLCENLRANGLTNVLAQEAACGACIGTAGVPSLDYTAEANFGGVSLIQTGLSGHEVEVLPIDALNLAECGLLKIDVEGFEFEVISGALETIRRCRPIIYIENDREGHQQTILSSISNLGYHLYWHTPPVADEANFNGVQENIFGGLTIYSINMLCVPSERGTFVKALEEIDPASWRSPKGRFNSPS